MMCEGKGTLVLNKELSAEAFVAVSKLDTTSVDWKRCIDLGSKTIELDDESVKYFDREFEELVEVLKPLGYTVVEGRIDYWGDYEGVFIVENNVLTDIPKESIDLMLSDDEVLFEEMSRRGYICIKKITSEHIEKAEQCLVDNGIEDDEADTVLQALGYILMDKELYPDSEVA